MDDYWRVINDTIIDHSFLSMLKQDYLNWTGRMSAQALVYILFSKKYLFISTFIINTINSIMFYLFLTFSFKIAVRNKYSICSKEFIIYSFFFLLMFSTTGFIGQMLWKTAAIQYFWGISLTAVLYYYVIIQNKKLIIFSLFTGLFIGLYNEQFVGVLLLLCLSYFIESKIHKRTMNRSLIFFTIGLVIGGAILISAPGNYARMDTMSSHSHSIIDQIAHLYTSFKYSVWPNTKIIVVLFALFFILAITNKQLSKKSVALYSITLIVSIFVMTPVVYSYGIQIRLMVIYYVIFFIAVVQQFYDNQTVIVTVCHNFLRKIYVFLFVAILYLMLTLGALYFSLHQISQQQDEIAIKATQSNPESIINVPVFGIPDNIGPNEYGIISRSIACNSGKTNNKAFAEFYNIKGVKAENC